MFQLFRTHFADPRTLRDEELEPTFIVLKNKTLAVSPYQQESKFKHLQSRLEAVLARILTRHERYVIEIEASCDTWGIVSLFNERRGQIWETAVHYPNKELHLSSTKTEPLFFLAWFAYLGGVVKNVGIVHNDATVALNVLNFLIQERAYVPATFLKGLMLKYGLEARVPPDLVQARMLLNDAAEKGVGGAIIELRQFQMHERLGYARHSAS